MATDMQTAPSERSGVRFSDNHEEIDPPPSHHFERDDISNDVQQELKNLTLGIHKSRVQEQRMQHFAFEPVSLPPSRAPSPTGSRSSRPTSQRASSHNSPLASPSLRAQHGQTPPLTPSASQAKPGPTAASSHGGPRVSVDNSSLTPQLSPGSKDQNERTSQPSSRPQSRASSPSSRSRFSLGAGQGSQGPSRDSSPRRSTAPRESKRKQAQAALDSLESRLKVGASKRSSHSGTSRSASSTDLKEAEKEAAQHHHHGLFGSRHRHDDEQQQQQHRHGASMSDLKRFFKFGHKSKSSSEPKSRASTRSGVSTPPTSKGSIAAVPFADDHGLESKYGKFGKVLGSGAGGSVRLMKRSSDGVTFAVKQFRPRHAYESEREYNKKVTAEFCVGSTLHHGNIIETMDIIHEHGSWYEVMEYAPYDLFAIVMTGKMSKPEVTCCFLQILSGVSYLHSMGLAHRDLKLDNVVVSEHGIMKLIDFGSAVVFRYPFENETVRASGIVGSDPYLAPEVYDETKYDPQAVDIWSMAIIYCCMALRRFPWKLPRTSDTSYRYFIADPTPGTPSVDSLRKRSQALAAGKSHEESIHGITVTAQPETSKASTEAKRPSQQELAKVEGKDSRPITPDQAEQKAPQTIKGPWRLLRLLPRDSRYIIGRMLDVDPKSRATLEEVQSDAWISSQPVCRQKPGGQVIRAPGHDHTLEPSAGSSAPPAKAK